MNHKAGRIMRAIGTAFRAGCTALILAALVGCIMAGAAWAIVKPEDIAGRWALRGSNCAIGACKALYDLSPCGEGWCGVEVEEGGKCGQTSIHLVAEKKPDPEQAVFSGQFRPAKGADPYVVEARIGISDSGARVLRILGHTGGQFQPFRRTYPLAMNLERIAGAECHGEPKTS